MSDWEPERLNSEAVEIGVGVAFQWIQHEDPDAHHPGQPCTRDLMHLWIWHDCSLILGEGTVAPGERFGWRPAGVRSHQLVAPEPLSISPSVYWSDCCGLHGFITDGAWRTA